MSDDTIDTLLLEYDRYEQQYGEPERLQPNRNRTQRAEAVLELAEPEPGGAELPMTYRPARFEAGWLGAAVRPFYEQMLITDVVASVKGGKEASVYCCRAHPDLGVPLLAAKVYRPRQFRNLRNDKMYKEGRPVLTADGRAVKKTDTRLMRAIGKKTEFGVQAEHTSWLMYEYTTLERLCQAGAAVPRPVAASDNAILMGYCGDLHTPAPALSQIHLDPAEARTLFDEVVRNIALMAEMGFVHGDLSAYNILYWQGRVTLIDFPQVTSIAGNQNAAFILHRDITRVCEYFTAQGVTCDAQALTRRLVDTSFPITEDS